MKHLDLFSGIGGFALAAQQNGFKTVAFCEIAEYPRKVLEKNFPGIPIHHDINKLDGTKYENIELITGGFPCQPFSVAGRQKGIKDHRDLWSQMFRIIQQAKPTFLLAENVANFTNMAFTRTKLDLESEGYTVQSFIIPACAKNAQHRRDRVWIVAYNNSKRKQGSREEKIRGEQGISRSENERGFKNFIQRHDIHQSKLCRTTNGLPERLDAIGNAIVPQIASEIIRYMKAL